ncbi:MAG: anthranilate phosphoribosyltransferase [Dehalococcoidia bacterium]|nr:anthranilate phosphoribosyltransferase [Dehalococcoidia bacterium]
MIKDAIAQLVERRSLSEAQSQAVMAEIMDGATTPAQLAAFLIALRMKGETAGEVLGMARVMRDRALPVSVPGPLLDTCGTGGDGSGTFNISTAAAFVAAAAGIRVAKHGNRSASSLCGSADVLEALGARIALTPEQASLCIERIGFAFLFAPAYHPAMKHAAPVRSEIGVRTVFNILGPLANPARATRQVLGVARADLAPLMAAVLPRLGVEHALVVHGQDGLDEISLGAPTTIHEVRGAGVTTSVITPQSLGLPSATIEQLAGGDKHHNAAIIRDLFRGAAGPKRDALLANAAAALYVGGAAPSINDGIPLAARLLDSGAALTKLDAYVKLTQTLA